MEDVCDNLFNLDPYHQQGGDMVRLGGMSYSCAPNETIGKRISDLKLPGGKAVEANKSYRIAGWASVSGQQGPPVWDIVASYLRGPKHLAEASGSGVALQGVDGNPGFGGS
jgi:sulfur-oxidizing protein SoxB